MEMVKICPYCGKEFKTNRPTAIICGDADCLRKRKAETKRSRERADRGQRTCKCCGKLFTPSKQNIKYCSTECREGWTAAQIKSTAVESKKERKEKKKKYKRIKFDRYDGYQAEQIRRTMELYGKAIL